MHSGDFYWLIGAFLDATAKFNRYLVLDSHTKSDDHKRVVSNILPEEDLTYYSAH